jgi:elongation factor Ts
MNKKTSSKKEKVSISAAEVKKLRKETGAGIMDCKSALEEAKGDFEKAKKIIEKRGIEKAAKKQERATCQGYVATYTHSTGKVGAIVEVLCETDFVARNEDFQSFAREICLQVAAMDPKNDKELLKQEYIRDPSKKIEEVVKTHIAKFGENIRIRNFQRFEI